MLRLLVTLPLRLVALLIAVPTRLSARLLRFSIATTWRTSRVAVRSSIVSFLLGVGVGWFLTTPTGRHAVQVVRHAVRGRVEAPPTDEALAQRVGAALGADARTWHLPRPRIDCRQGTVELVGSVPHEEGRAALTAVAAAVAGVDAVVDRLTVDGTDAPAGTVVPV